MHGPTVLTVLFQPKSRSYFLFSFLPYTQISMFKSIQLQNRYLKGLWENVDWLLIAHRSISQWNDWVIKGVVWFALAYKIKFSRLRTNNFQRIYRFRFQTFFCTHKHFNTLFSTVIFSVIFKIFSKILISYTPESTLLFSSYSFTYLPVDSKLTLKNNKWTTFRPFDGHFHVEK